MVKYIYICSANFSGSTLLDLLVGSHSRVESLGEISNLPMNIALDTTCLCGHGLRECSLWNKVVSALSMQLGISIWDDPLKLNLGIISGDFIKKNSSTGKGRSTFLCKLRKKIMSALRYAELRVRTSSKYSLSPGINEGIKNNILLYDTVRSILDVDVIVDSSKNYQKAMGIYKNAPDEVRIIYLIRDGRAVYYSGIKRNYSKSKSLRAWKNHNARALTLLKQHVAPEHVLRVMYEDLVGNTCNELAKICKFAGLEFEEGMLEYTTKSHHNTAGNDMRFSSSSLIKPPDVTWKEKMSKECMLYFNKKADALNQSFGYK